MRNGLAIDIASVVAALSLALQGTACAMGLANDRLADVNSLLQTWSEQPQPPQPPPFVSPLIEWLHHKYYKPIPNRLLEGEDDISKAESENDISEIPEDYNLTEWDLDAPKFDDPNIKVPSGGQFNLCKLGHFIPELILIGVMKAGTTSFAADMRQNPSIVFAKRCTGMRGPGFCENNTNKEAHFFDRFRNLGIGFMTTSYPKCSTEKRMVATDITPRYLMSNQAATTISNWYGPELQRRITFIAVVREPVERFQSDFYHAREEGWCGLWTKQTQFTEIIDGILMGNRWNQYVGGHYHCSDRLEASLYPEAFSRWFATFDPKQFTIVPFLHLTDSGRSSTSVVNTVWSRLGVPFAERQGTHFNHHTHPSLIVDLGEEKLQAFRSLVYIRHGPQQLATVFSQHPGATLFGYEGKFDDINALHDWLVNNW